MGFKYEKVERGDRFGRLTICSEVLIVKNGNKNLYLVDCICDCGKQKRVRVHEILNGNVRSCGCLSKENLTNFCKPGNNKKSFIVNGFRNCTLCEKTKPIAHFRKHKGCSDGYYTRCNECAYFIR